MNALKIFLGGAFFVGIMLFLVGMFVAPKHFNIKRTTTINAPAETVFPYVASLEAMDKWSPWSKKDPNMTNTFEGTPGAVGSVNTWDSTVEEVGAGSQTITSVTPNKSIQTQLDFIRPYESTSTASVRLKSNAKNTETEVSWGIRGDYSFMEGLFMMFMDMDAQIGPDFEQGLATLKTQVEQDNTIISSKDKMPANAN
jgi:uncharacterized protein YndB with AHSA1/START domain